MTGFVSWEKSVKERIDRKRTIRQKERPMQQSENIIIKDEKNLAIIPFANLSKNNKLSKIEVKITKEEDGLRKSGKIIVETSEGRYLPNSFDEDVLYALFKKCQEQGLVQKVYFTKFEVLNILGLSYGGKNYERLSKAIENLTLVNIINECYYDNKSKKFGKRIYNIFDDAYISDGKNKEEKLGNQENRPKDPDSWFVKISDLLFESMKSGYMKDMNLTLFFSFKKSTTRRLFKILDYFFMAAENFEYDLTSFSRNLMGSPNITNTKMRAVIKESVNDLLEYNIIKEYRFYKRNRVEYVYFERGEYFQKPKILLDKLSTNDIYRLKSIKDKMECLGISPNSYDEIINGYYIGTNGEVMFGELERMLNLCLAEKEDGERKKKKLHGGFFRKALIEKWNFQHNINESVAEEKSKVQYFIRGISRQIFFSKLEQAQDFCRKMFPNRLAEDLILIESLEPETHTQPT